MDNFPPSVSPDDIMVSICKRGQEYAWHTRHPELGALTRLPIKDLVDLTARGDYWFACLPASGTAPEVLRDQLLKVHGVTTYVSVGLPRPLPAMIRTWIRTYQHEDLHASIIELRAGMAVLPRHAGAGHHGTVLCDHRAHSQPDCDSRAMIKAMRQPLLRRVACEKCMIAHGAEIDCGQTGRAPYDRTHAEL